MLFIAALFILPSVSFAATDQNLITGDGPVVNLPGSTQPSPTPPTLWERTVDFFTPSGNSGSGGGGFFDANPNANFSSGGRAGDIRNVGNNLIDIINGTLVPVLFALAFIVFIYGVFSKYILSKGDQTAVEEGHKIIMWGIIAFAVIISVWGLVNIIVNTFGLSGFNAPRPPSSRSPY